MTSRTEWQRRADELWPDDWDMVESASGDGRWASVAWCGPLTVHLHRTEEAATAALAAIDATACGHSCIRDHEIVDLEDPGADTSHPRHRLERIGHLQGCVTCRYIFDGKAAGAARRRHEALIARYPFGVMYDLGKVKPRQPTAGVIGANEPGATA